MFVFYMYVYYTHQVVTQRHEYFEYFWNLEWNINIYIININKLLSTFVLDNSLVIEHFWITSPAGH